MAVPGFGHCRFDKMIFMELLRQYLAEIRNKPYLAVIDGYLALLGCGLAWYLREGYYGITYEKFVFWRTSSIICAVLLILAVAAYLIREKKDLRQMVQHELQAMKTADWFMLAYALINTVSFVFSINQDEALWGTAGWYVGWLSQILMVFWYFAVRKLYRWKCGSYGVLATGAVIVMIIGILQRLGILTISDGGGDGFFLTTIGNINWYAGYLSVMYPLIIGLFLTGEKREKRSVVLYCLLVVIASLACITNGSNSVYLIMPAVLISAGLLSLFSQERFYRYTLILAMTGIAFELVSLYVSLDPSESFFLGNSDNIGMALMRGHRGLVLTLVSTGLYLALQRLWSAKADKIKKAEITVMRIAVCAGFGLLAVLLVLQIFDRTGLDYAWGNRRGGLWHAAAVIYGKLPLLRKLFGVGPDCFAMYVSSDSASLILLGTVYDIRRVANAHSELLTMMINIGLSGTLVFFLASFFTVSSAASSLSSKESDIRRAAVIVILSAAGAFSNFTVSFQHLLVMPYLFVLLGAGGRKR